MVPSITTGGRSFEGAARYYLHDKKADTSDRVAWVETVNLPTADPDRAWRMMAHTAITQPELKAAAGIKATGRKLDKPVTVYSLAWHPDEKPTREQQLEAARETLAVLGLDDHQAMIVCHTDEPHAHVHVLVNRVNPKDGVAAPLSNSKRKLSEWALGYERRQGAILCPKREENAERRMKGEKVSEKRKPRDQYERDKAAANDNLTAIFVRTEQKQKDAALSARGRAMNARHRDEWEEARTAYAKAKVFLAERRDQESEAATARVKDAFRPQWTALFRLQEWEKRQQAEAYATITGRLTYWIRNRDLARWNDDDSERRGHLARAFNAIVDRDVMKNALARRHESERKKLAGKRNETIREELKPVRDKHSRALDGTRTLYLTHCQELREQQNRDHAAYRAEWRDRSQERESAFARTGGDRASKWAALEKLGEKSRTQDQGRGLDRQRAPGPR